MIKHWFSVKFSPSGKKTSQQQQKNLQKIDELLFEGFNPDFENKYHIEANTTPVLTGHIEDVTTFFKLADQYIVENNDIIEELTKNQ